MMWPLKALYGLFGKVSRGEVDLQATGYRSLRVAQVEPEYLELARAGRLFIAATSIATNGRAPVTDVPTTTANWCLFNPATNRNNHLAILEAGFWNSGGTTAVGQTLIGGVTPLPLATAIAANATGHTVGNTRGANPSGGAVLPFLSVNVTVPSMAAQFGILGSMESTADATVGAGGVWKQGGKHLVPPGHGFAVDIISGAGTSPKLAIYILGAILEVDAE